MPFHAGRHLVIGVEGKKLDDDLKTHLKKIRPSGIIFFSRNISSADQLKIFISEIRSILGEEVFFAIDHECGLVQRFEDGVTAFPGNMALGKSLREDWAWRQGEVMAQELLSLGVQVDLAPVLDVLTSRLNPGITLRSFGQDPNQVARFARAMILGMQSYGLAATAKHFPGKGAATVDAHEDLPFVDASQEEMQNIHLKPFQSAIESGVSFVMTSHVVYSSLEKEIPATFSKKIVTGLLREHLSFKNVILSDDLEMGAIVRRFTFEEAVVRAVQAGHDFVLVCHQRDLIEKANHALETAYHERRLIPENLEKSVSRLKKVLGGLTLISKTSKNGAGSRLASEISNASVEMVQKGRFFSDPLKGKEVLILVPDFSFLSDRYFFESPLLREPSFFSDCLGSYGCHPQEIRTGFVKSDCWNKIESFPSDFPVILFSFDALHFSTQKELLLKVQKKFSRCAVVLLRNPNDLEFVGSQTTCIQSFGFRTPQIRAVMDLLCRGAA